MRKKDPVYISLTPSINLGPIGTFPKTVEVDKVLRSGGKCNDTLLMNVGHQLDTKR